MPLNAVASSLCKIALLGAILAACEPISEITGEIEEKADEGLAQAERLFCNAPTNGALRRRYGTTPDLWNARETLCARYGPALPPPPLPVDPPAESLSTRDFDDLLSEFVSTP